MQKSDLVKIMAVVWLQWPQFELQNALVDLWFRIFKNENLDDVKIAFESWLKQPRKFPPTTGEIFELLRKNTENAAEQITEGEAWRTLLACVELFGARRGDEAASWLKSRSSQIWRSVEILGWRQICAWKLEDEVANRAHFWRVFSDLRKRDELAKISGREIPKPLEALQLTTRKNINSLVIKLTNEVKTIA